MKNSPHRLGSCFVWLIVVFAFGLTSGPAAAAGSCSYQQATGGQELLSTGDTWVIPSNPVSGFSGSAALQTLPDDRDRITTGYSTTAPELGVTANFTTTGTHYVFVRGHGVRGGSDSVHVGLDGVEVPTSQGISIPRTSGYEWSNGTHTVEVTNTGVHTLEVWMREDGTRHGASGKCLFWRWQRSAAGA